MKSFKDLVEDLTEAAPRKSRKNMKWVIVMNYNDNKTGKRETMDMPVLAKTEDEAFKKARQRIITMGHKMISSRMKDHPTEQ